MPLFVVQEDKEYVLLRRRGRFTLEAAQAADGRHRAAAVKAARQKMIRDMARRGYDYVADGRDELQGPEPHLAFSEDDRPDHAHLAAPDPRDLSAQARFEREEKNRQAKDVPVAENLVDFRLVLTFRKATGSSYRTLVGGATTTRR